MSSTPHPHEPLHVFQWRRINDRLTTSGQPNEAQLGLIHQLGVSHIINLGLHTHEKALRDESASVAALGMSYIHIPVEFEAPTQADFDRFCSAMTQLAGRTLHVHCIANLRVSAFLYRYRYERCGVPEPEARRDMESVWRPGGPWADLIGRGEDRDQPHRIAGRDY